MEHFKEEEMGDGCGFEDRMANPAEVRCLRSLCKSMHGLGVAEGQEQTWDSLQTQQSGKSGGVRGSQGAPLKEAEGS